MAVVTDVVEYRDEGFAILEDSQGKFLMFKNTEEIVHIPEPIDELTWPAKWHAKSMHDGLSIK